MTARWLSGVRLRFPDTGAVLTLGHPPEQAPPVELRRVGSFWRLPARLPAVRAGAGVLLRPQAGPEAPTAHAVLDAELWLLETHKEKLPGAVWEPSGRAPDVRGKVAGAWWVMVGGARLVVGVLPRNLLDPAEIEGAGGAVAADKALHGLRRMVEDLIANADLLDPKPQDATLGIAGAAGPADLRQPVLRLHRLQGLLREGGVLDTWDAMIADPAVRLEARHPTRPAHRARSPVWSGARGPWALAGGWSPEQPLGRVHDRVVHRTADTPPNRLAVQLAARVRSTLDELRSALCANEDGPYHHLVDELHQRAVAVERAPAFAEVSRTARVPLDSPALQSNRRAQPLLRAWAHLDRAAEVRVTVPLDEILLEPLRRTYDLYELWCTVRLRQLLDEKLGLPMGCSDSDAWAEWQYSNDGVRVALGASMGSAIVERSETEDGYWTSARDVPLESWGLPARPDGYLLVSGRSGPEALILWDAKYRRITYSFDLAAVTYQAHAFRDCVTHARGAPALWSFILHPTEASTPSVPSAFLLVEGGRPERRIPQSDGDGSLQLVELAGALSTRRGGVGILQARPGDNNPSGVVLAVFVAQLVAAARCGLAPSGSSTEAPAAARSGLDPTGAPHASPAP
jgi:hypothetical protein